MDTTESFEGAEQASPELSLDRNPTESSASKCASENVKAGCFIDGKVDKKVYFSRLETKKNVSEDKLHRKFILGNCNNIFEVLGKGTKLMKSMHWPTVIVKLQTGNLKKSTLYYTILEIETEESKHTVPAIMFSNPYAHRKTKLAELLPLSIVKCSKSTIGLAPMMARKRYRCVIRRGFSFKIISLIPVGAFDGQREIPWNKYDIRMTALRNHLRKTLEKDINQMALLLAKVMLRSAGIVARRSCLQKYATLSQITFSPTLTMGAGKEENLEDKGPTKRAKFSTNKVVPKELKGCTFQNSVDPNERRRYLKGARLSTYSLNQLNDLAEYIYVSDII